MPGDSVPESSVTEDWSHKRSDRYLRHLDHVINPLRMAPAGTCDYRASLGSPDCEKACTQSLSATLTPFLSDYRPGAWYSRHADLALTLLLAALQVPGVRQEHMRIAADTNLRLAPCRHVSLTPASKAALVGKAAAIVVSTSRPRITHPVGAPLCFRARVERPSAGSSARARCRLRTAVVALASAMDLRLFSDAGAASTTLAAASYVMAVFFAFAIAVLLAGIVGAMLRGVREEQVRISTSAMHRHRLRPQFDVEITRLGDTSRIDRTIASETAEANAPKLAVVNPGFCRGCFRMTLAETLPSR